MRRVQELVAVLQVLDAPEILDCQAHAGALGVPVDEPRAGFLVDGVQVELLAQLAVIALLDLLQALQVRIQIRLRFPRGAIDALEHLVLFVSAPVGARDGGELERIAAKRTSVLHMGTTAEVREGVLRVGGDLLSLGQLGDELQLIGLAREQPLRLGAAHHCFR